MAYKEYERGFFGLGGTKQDQSVLLLPDIHSPEGSKNIRHDKRHRIRKVEGYRKLTLSEIDGAAVRALFDYPYESGGSPVRELLAVVNDTAYEVATDTGIPTSLGSGLNATELPAAAKIGDTMYLASGRGAAVKKWDGVTWASAGLSQPAAATIAAGAAGSFNGQYYAKVAYIDSADNEGAASPASDPAILEEEIAALSIIPTGPVGTKARVIYLTVGDNSEIFYYAHTLAGNVATTVDIDLSDQDLIENGECRNYGDAPPSGVRLAATAAGRLFVANTDGDRSTSWYSEIGIAESFWALNRISINKQDGDELRHQEPEFSRVGETQRVVTMVYFKTWGIWNLFGVQPRSFDPDPFVLEKSKSPVGTIAGRTVVKVPVSDDNVLAFLAPDKKIYIYNGYTSIAISAPAQAILDDINLKYAYRSFSIHVPSLDMVLFVFPTGGAGNPNYGLAWDYIRNVWHPYPDWTRFLCGILHFDEDESELVYVGQGRAANGGYVYQMFTGTDFDGEAFESIWRSKPLLSEDGKTKLIEGVQVELLQEPGVNLTLKAWPGYADPDTVEPTVEVAISAQESGVTHRKEYQALEDSNGDPIVDEEVTIQISDNSQAAPWTMNGFRLLYKIFPRKQTVQA